MSLKEIIVAPFRGKKRVAEAAEAAAKAWSKALGIEVAVNDWGQIVIFDLMQSTKDAGRELSREIANAINEVEPSVRATDSGSVHGVVFSSGQNHGCEDHDGTVLTPKSQAIATRIKIALAPFVERIHNVRAMMSSPDEYRQP